MSSKPLRKNLFGVLGRNQQGIGTCALVSSKKYFENCKLSFLSKKILNTKFQTNFLNSEGNEEIQDQVYDAIEDNVGTSFMDNEGVGLYKTQSMANHRNKGLRLMISEKAISYVKIGY